MISDSYILAIFAAVVYIVGYSLIHRYTTAKWFALEVLWGGGVGATALGIGLWSIRDFHVEYFAALYATIWFCFFFVSGIYYASISLAIVRYLARKPNSTASMDEVYRDCVESPFLERAQFLVRAGQAAVDTSGAPGLPHYVILPKGNRTAEKILAVQRFFGFGTTGYYSVPSNESSMAAAPTPAPISAFTAIASSAVIGLCLAQTLVVHGIGESVRRGGVGIVAVLILGLALFFVVRAVLGYLSTASCANPAQWVIWMPLSVLLLFAQAAGLVFGGTPTLASDKLLFGVTLAVVTRGLWVTPLRAIWPLLVVWFVGVLIWYQTGGTGMLHNELVDRYLPSYLTKRPWLNILFDPVIEFDDNRARPISLIFDFIDYRLVQASAMLGAPHFKMPSYPAFTLACAGTLYWFCLRDLKLDRRVAIPLSMLFLSTPAIAFHTLYRSAKLGAAFTVLIVFTSLYRYVSDAETESTPRLHVRRLAAIWVGCAMLPMFDDLGAYYICIALASTASYAIIRRTKASWALCAAAASTLCFAYLYRYALSQRLYTWINGAVLESPYNVDKGLYDKIQIEASLRKGALLAADTFRFEFGNLSVSAVIAIALLGFIVYSWSFRVPWGTRVDAPRVPFLSGLILVGVLLMVVVQFGIMSHFHPPIANYADVRRVYYSLPTIALFTMLVATVLKPVCEGHRNVSKVVGVFLLLLLVNNVDADVDHLKVIQTGHLKEFFVLSDNTVGEIRAALAGNETSSAVAKRVLAR